MLHGIRGLKLAFPGDFCKCLTVEIRLCIRKQQFVGATTDLQHRVGGPLYFRRLLGIVKSRDHFLPTAGRCPVGNGVGAQIALRCRIRVVRGPDIDTAFTGVVDKLCANVSTSIVVRALQIEMTENDAESRFLSNTYGLLHRCVIANALVYGAEIAIVCIVNRTIIFCCRFRKLDNFLGRRIGTGNIEEAGRKAESALLHTLPNQRMHCPHFFRIRFPVVRAHDLFTNGTVTDKQESVNADAMRFPLLHAPGDVFTDAVYTEHNGRNTLVQVRHRVATVITIQHRMTVRINESRRHP